jgi:hypothetical protein
MTTDSRQRRFPRRHRAQTSSRWRHPATHCTRPTSCLLTHVQTRCGCRRDIGPQLRPPGRRSGSMSTSCVDAAEEILRKPSNGLARAVWLTSRTVDRAHQVENRIISNPARDQHEGQKRYPYGQASNPSATGMPVPGTTLQGTPVEATAMLGNVTLLQHPELPRPLC